MFNKFILTVAFGAFAVFAASTYSVQSANPKDEVNIGIYASMGIIEAKSTWTNSSAERGRDSHLIYRLHTAQGVVQVCGNFSGSCERVKGF
jgi:outer membrane protease